jgi:hypothetical protein
MYAALVHAPRGRRIALGDRLNTLDEVDRIQFIPSECARQQQLEHARIEHRVQHVRRQFVLRVDPVGRRSQQRDQPAGSGKASRTGLIERCCRLRASQVIHPAIPSFMNVEISLRPARAFEKRREAWPFGCRGGGVVTWEATGGELDNQGCGAALPSQRRRW